MKPAPCSIHVQLYENEQGASDFNSWPPAVQNIHIRELDLWAYRNPTRDITEQSHSIDPVRRITVTEFQYTDKVST